MSHVRGELFRVSTVADPMDERAGIGDVGFWADADGAEALQHYRTLVNLVDDGIYQLTPAGGSSR